MAQCSDPWRNLRQPPPFVDSSIWVSLWVRAREFRTPGQRCVVLPMGFSLGLSTQHPTICPLSYWCPPGYEPKTIELQLGTISCFMYSNGWFPHSNLHNRLTLCTSDLKRLCVGVQAAPKKPNIGLKLVWESLKDIDLPITQLNARLLSRGAHGLISNDPSTRPTTGGIGDTNEFDSFMDCL